MASHFFFAYKEPTVAPKEEKTADPVRLAKLLEAREQAYATLPALDPEVQKEYGDQFELLNREIDTLIEAGKPKDAWGQTVG